MQTVKKVYDNYQDVKQIANDIGIKKTIRFLFENLKKNKLTMNSEDVKNIYDEEYSNFLDCRKIAEVINGFNIYIYSQFIFDFLANIPDKNDKVILDFGCGTGELSMALSSIGYQVHGIDYSELAIKYANKKKSENNSAKNPIFECVDYFILNRKYNYIIFGDVVEHVSMSELQNIIKKASTLLTDDGKIIINTPNGRIDPYGNHFFWVLLAKVYNFFTEFINIINKKKLTEFNLKHAFYTQSHINIMYPEQLKDILKKNDFTEIKFNYLQDRKIPFSSFFSSIGISTDMTVIAGIK